MKDFATHARTIVPDLSQLTSELVVELHRETHAPTMDAAVAATPVRTGGLKAAWTSVPGNLESAMESMQPTKVKNAHPAATIINMGRRRSENAWRVRRGGKAHTVKPGKMLGSSQAPRGIKGPVLREVSQQEEAIFRRAAATVERKGDR